MKVADRPGRIGLQCKEEDGPGRAGVDWLVSEANGPSRTGRNGKETCVTDSHGRVWLGRAGGQRHESHRKGTAWQERLVEQWPGWERTGRKGKDGVVRSGSVRQEWLGWQRNEPERTGRRG